MSTAATYRLRANLARAELDLHGACLTRRAYGAKKSVRVSSTAASVDSGKTPM